MADLCKKRYIRRLKDFGVIEHPKLARGKGSELVVYRPESSNSLKSQIFTLIDHGMGKDVGYGLVNACLRRFDIDKDEFFKGI